MTRRLEGRTALVTGASRGIGFAVAERFAREGAHVIALARTTGGLEELDDRINAAGGEATLVPMDLTAFDQVDMLGPTLAQRFGGLDILVANAGLLGDLTPLGHLEEGKWDAVMATNATANWRLIRTCDPLLRHGPAGRALFVTDIVAQTCPAYWAAYAVSKAALEALVKVYVAETANSDVRVNLIDPGVVRTKLRARAFPGENPAHLPEPAAITDAFVDLAAADCQRHGEVIQAQP